ncbi:MAG TPA: hypothetical protein VIG64_07290 [Actinomycetota bacterium]
MNSLLADAAPRPLGKPDVAAIIKRGGRMRMQRMAAVAVAIPVVAAALWAGAQTGLTKPVVTPPAVKPPAADRSCDWHSEALMVFLDKDSTPAEGRALARQVRAMDHVKSVEWNDLFEEKKVTINSDIPRASQRLSRRAFPPWLDIRLDDPSYAGGVALSLAHSPSFGPVAGANRQFDKCTSERVRETNHRLRMKVRELNKKLLRQMRRTGARSDRRTSMVEVDASTGIPADPDHRRLWRRVQWVLGSARAGTRPTLGSSAR